MNRLIVGACVLLTLYGCASPPPLATASGNPEITIEGITRKQVVDHLVDRYTSKGLTLRSVTEYKIVVSKPADKDFLTMLLYGSRNDGVPEYRIHHTLIDRAGGVKVFARGEIVTNPGSAFERVTDVTDGSRQDLQTGLEGLRAQFAGQQSPSPTPMTATVSQVAPKAGSATQTETRDAYAAERLAKQKQCHDAPESRLSAKGPGFETYNVGCINGDTMTIRCEYGNCRVLQ